MTRKIIALLTIFTVLLSVGVFATPTEVTFDEGYLPDGWTVQNPPSDTPVAGTKLYADEKMVYVAKTENGESTPVATRTFEKIFGSGNIWFTFSFTGEDKSYVELNDGSKVAIKFSISEDGFAYIDDEDTENVILSSLEENEKYTVKVSGTFRDKTTTVTVNSVDTTATTVPFLTTDGAGNLDTMKISAPTKGNSVSLYHFSTDSTNSKYCWDEFQEEDDIAEWTFTKTGGVSEIRSTGNGSYLSMYVAKSGQKQSDGSTDLESDIRADIADTSGTYKVTFKYAAIGDASELGKGTIFRLCRANGSYWLTSLGVTGTQFGYNPEGNTGRTDVAVSGLSPLDVHTVTIYANRSSHLYDLYFDGEEIGTDIGQVSAGADVYLGWMLWQRDASHIGGVRIYDFKVEDDFVRGSSISEGAFVDSLDQEILTLGEGTIYGQYEITNEDKLPVDVMVVMMQYEGDKLVNITATPDVAAVGDTTTVKGEINITEVTENTKLYMCLWDGLEDIVPLTDTMSILD